MKFLSGLALLAMTMTSCDETTETIGSSLTDNMDLLHITTDTFTVSSRSIVADSVLSRSVTGFLGKIKDPETGTYITGDFMAQFSTQDQHVFYSKDTIESKIDGEVYADSCFIRLYSYSYYGDTLSTMKVTAYEMEKPMQENRLYYSNYDPIANGYIREDGIKVDKVFSLADQNESKSNNGYFTISIPLNEPYTDKNGNTYNNYGTYLMRQYEKHPEYFKNPHKFVTNVCPGFYFKLRDGIGAMAYVNLSTIEVFYRVNINDTISTKSSGFSGTEEVLQTTRVTNDKRSVERLASDNSCTFVKSPAGIFTELTFPVDEITMNHSNDTLNSARIQLSRIQNEVHSNYSLSLPTYLLMVPRDSLYTFFEKNSLPNNITSYVQERDYTTVSTSTSSSRKVYKDSYTFKNISNLIHSMAEAKKKGGSDYTATHPNWNKVVLVPVSVSTATTSSNTQVINRVVNDMSLTSLRLVGGSENPNEDIKISVIYSKFSGNK